MYRLFILTFRYILSDIQRKFLPLTEQKARYSGNGDEKNLASLTCHNTRCTHTRAYLYVFACVGIYVQLCVCVCTYYMHKTLTDLIAYRCKCALTQCHVNRDCLGRCGATHLNWTTTPVYSRSTDLFVHDFNMLLDGFSFKI